MEIVVLDRDRWARLETVFAEALARTGDARSAYVDGACADDAELRAEVESLLQAHQEDSGFLEPAREDVLGADAAAAATPLEPGTRLGPFEIVAWMGAGGMGDVYHARDTRLDRSVAVKVLTRPTGVADDALQRLEHEARAISRLVHPHVCTLHDIGSARVGEREIRFLVMELVSGETLATVLARGPLTVDVALQLAIQIADALAAAHSVGIVHRDLKPQNVMITATGVKLLDFGLALVTNAAKRMAPEASRPPVGSIVGTAHYMAPEQIRGEDVDARADVFSFGLMLHEMLTAARVFHRPTIAETLNAILHDPAPPLPQHVPGDIRAIVRRCLEKERALRFQSADALAGALRAAESARHDGHDLSRLERHRLSFAGIAGEAPRFRRWPGVVSGAAVMAAAAAATLWVITTRRLPEPSSTPPLMLRRLTFDSGLQKDPTLSPDGRYAVYASNQAGNFDLWKRPLDGGQAVQLTSSPADDIEPDWSPDGATIVFRSERDGGGIFALSLSDGHTRRLLPSGFVPRWSPDGTHLLFRPARFEPEYAVASADGKAVQRIELPPVETRGFSTAAGWHPSGRIVFLFGYRAELSLAALEPGATRPVRVEIDPGVRARIAALRLAVADGQPLAWSRDGRTLYFSATATTQDLWRLTVDPRSLRAEKGPTSLTTGPEAEATPTVSSRNGLAFAQKSRWIRVTLLELGADGRTLTGSPQDVTPRDVYAVTPALSPDGQQLAFVVESPGALTQEVHVMALGSRTSRLLRVADSGRGEDLYGPRWARDGTRIMYSFREFRPAPMRSSIRLLDLRTGAETLLTSHAATRWADNPWDWSSDSRWILSSGTRYVAGKNALVRLRVSDAPAAERRAEVLTALSDGAVAQAQASPDERWVCYMIIRGPEGHATIYATSMRGGPGTALTATDGFYDKPRWSADGRLVYFLALENGVFNLAAVPFDPHNGRAAGAAFHLAQDAGRAETFTANPGEIELSVAGKRLAISTAGENGAIWLLE